MQNGNKNLKIMIGIVLEQVRKIENNSRTLEHVFAGVMRGVGDEPGYLFYMLVNAAYHKYQHWR